MRTPSFVRSTCVALVLLICATVSYSQDPQASTPSPIPQQIIYTGKLLGYFRMRAGQERKTVGCSAPSDSNNLTAEDSPDYDSRAATKFLTQRQIHRHAILLSTGDNFAPQLEAREFYRDPAHRVRTDSPYSPQNKELFYGSENGWIFYQTKADSEIEQLSKRIDAGVGTIPSDNVGCFLSAARFAAVVPGKHDFYFGAERVRQLARFMAGLPDMKKIGLSPTEEADLASEEKHDRPPQMLGANLVIKTVRVDGQVTRPDLRSTPWFTPEWPKAHGQVTNVQEGASVYPWFTTVHLRLINFQRNSNVLADLVKFLSGRPATEELLAQFATLATTNPGSIDTGYLDELRSFRVAVENVKAKTIYVCPSKGDPNELKKPGAGECVGLQKNVRIAGSNVVYDLPLPIADAKLVEPDPSVDKDLTPSSKDRHFSLLTPARNYGLCIAEGQSPNAKGPNANCIRFSVHTPFYYHPYSGPRVVDSITKGARYYTDPDPFVFLQSNKTRPYDTVIFGLVDPHLAEQVGVLNFSWRNENNELKTLVSAEDPAQALREQLEYFQRWYAQVYESTGRAKFSGLKILLIEASPERARVFATRFPDFHIVVTAADDAQGTSGTALSTNNKFVAVPIPYYDTAKEQGVVHFGSVMATQNGGSWNLTSKLIDPAPVPPTKSASQEFWQRIGEVLPECLPADFQSSDKPTGLERIKWLTLCAMRVETGADVALLQKRDFFDQLPIEVGNTKEDVQQILNRVIWKGDLLSLLYVPGSALKKALQQSRSYQAEESSPLSLADQKWRQLESLGIKYNAVTREYLVNEVPIEDKKIYTIATSDYIGAGDTGYPDLATAALNPRTHAEAFPSQLRPISMVVCRKLYVKEAEALCAPDIERNTYLDLSDVQQTRPYSRPSFGKKLWDLFPFKWPSKDKSPSSTSDGLQQEAEQRPIWTWSLRNFSVGFNGLTKNLSDADIAAKFSGVPTPSVTAKKTSTVSAQIDMRLSRSSHANEFFLGVGGDFKEQSTGDVSPQIVQINNRATSDIGVIHALRGGRSLTRVGVALYVHFETPLQKPFSTFTLNAQDRLKITQSRNISILPRLGLRWLNRGNSFEAGFQVGREIDAFAGYRFSTNGNIAMCTPSSTETFAACVNRLIKAGAVTKDSIASAILEGRPRAGLYARINLTLPITAKAKYVFTEEGDLFFNFRGDTPIDTRYRDISTHSLKFVVWPSLSIGPTLRLLLYQNKVNGDFLFQRQFGFETSLSFDLFNRREKMVQIRHKP